MSGRIKDALRLIRQYHNLKQTEAAEKLGISKSYLSEIESGKKTPTLETLELYSKAFDMPLSSIIMFSEKLDSPKKEKARDFVLDKAIRILDWISDAKTA